MRNECNKKEKIIVECEMPEWEFVFNWRLEWQCFSLETTTFFFFLLLLFLFIIIVVIVIIIWSIYMGKGIVIKEKWLSKLSVDKYVPYYHCSKYTSHKTHMTLWVFTNGILVILLDMSTVHFPKCQKNGKISTENAGDREVMWKLFKS